MTIPSHYAIFDLPEPSHNSEGITAQRLKAAYRAALLRYHPDKSKAAFVTPNHRNGSGTAVEEIPYTIDHITQAYAVLSVPKLRAQYDRELILGANNPSQAQREKEVFKTGVEIVDLDDLDYDESENLWYRSCRCGDERGFVVKEADLEEAADDGEINAGCRGCSLWMKVLFGVVEDNAEGNGAG